MISLGSSTTKHPQGDSKTNGSKAKLDKNCMMISSFERANGIIPMYPMNLIPPFIPNYKTLPGYDMNAQTSKGKNDNHSSHGYLPFTVDPQTGRVRETPMRTIATTSSTAVKNTFQLPPNIVSHQIEMPLIEKTNSIPYSFEIDDEETDSSSDSSDQSTDSEHEDEER